MVTETKSQGGVIEVTLDQTPGQIETTARIESEPFVGPPPVQIRIRIEPSGLGQLRGSIIGALSNQADIPRSVIRNQIEQLGGFRNTSELRDDLTIREDYTLRGSPEEWIRTVSKHIRIPEIPVPQGFDINEEIPDRSKPQISIKVFERGGIETTIRNIFGASASTFTIEPTTLVDTREVEFDCGLLHSDIDSSVDSIRTAVTNMDQLDEDVNDLESVSSEMRSRTGDPIERISPGYDITDDVDTATIREWRSTAESADATPIPGGVPLSVSNLQSRADSVRDRIQDIDDLQCRRMFLERLNDADVETFVELAERADELKSSILSVLPRISSIPCEDEFPDVDSSITELENDIQEEENLSPSDIQEFISRGDSIRSDIQSLPNCVGELEGRLDAVLSVLPSDTDCNSPPRFVRNSVAQATTAARTFSNARPVARTPERTQRVRNSIQDARQSVESLGDNICESDKRALLSDLNSAESTLDQSQPDQEQLSCENQFSGIDRRLTAFEESVLSINPPVNAETFETFATNADNIIQRIENEVPAERERCRRQFTRRTEGILERVGRVGSRARVETELSREEVERRQERVEQLRGRVRDVTEGIEGISLPSR